MAVWGVTVRWGSSKGAVAMQDPLTGEWWEIEGCYLADDNPRLDLRWLRGRAAQAKEARAAEPAQEHIERLNAEAGGRRWY